MTPQEAKQGFAKLLEQDGELKKHMRELVVPSLIHKAIGSLLERELDFDTELAAYGYCEQYLESIIGGNFDEHYDTICDAMEKYVADHESAVDMRDSWEPDIHDIAKYKPLLEELVDKGGLAQLLIKAGIPLKLSVQTSREDRGDSARADGTLWSDPKNVERTGWKRSDL